MEFEEQGFCILLQCIGIEELDRLKALLEQVRHSEAAKQKNGNVYGIRDLLNQIPQLRQFVAGNALREIIARLSERPMQLVRAIYFDKTENANWGVLWHQDTTVALRQKADTKGFDLWTVKAGICHAKPPVHYMQNMISLRIHLDNCDAGNGALRVIPGSHKYGYLNNAQIQDFTRDRAEVICAAEQGSIMAMKPLLLHASSSGSEPSRRRVLHFEFSPDALPAGLEWYDAV